MESAGMANDESHDGTALTLEARRQIEASCARLASEFCLTSDQGEYEAYGALYALDGSFARPGLSVSGRAEIVAALKKRPPHLVMRHITANTVVDVIDYDHAVGRGNHLVVVHDRSTGRTEPPAVVDYVDSYVRTDEGWKIASREVTLAF